jgi:hypothetical protein
MALWPYSGTPWRGSVAAGRKRFSYSGFYKAWQRAVRAAGVARVPQERSWTVAQLAKTAALLGSAFFERFTRTVGMPPMEYPTVFQTIEPLRANTTTTFRVSFLALSSGPGILCPLPQTTTRMVVQLWAQRGRTNTSLLTREFAHSYTFVLP